MISSVGTLSQLQIEDTSDGSEFVTNISSKHPNADMSSVSAARTVSLSQLHSAACSVLSQPFLVSQVIIWGPIATVAIVTGIHVTDVQLVDDEDGIADEDYQDYQEEVEEAEVIRINNLLSDFGNIAINKIAT